MPDLLDEVPSKSPVALAHFDDLGMPERRSHHGQQPPIPGQRLPGQHIIDMDLWNQVQAAIASPPKERANRNRAETPGLLKGMLRCGHCGTSMAIAFTKRHGRLYRYYNCHRARRTSSASSTE